MPELGEPGPGGGQFVLELSVDGDAVLEVSGPEAEVLAELADLVPGFRQLGGVRVVLAAPLGFGQAGGLVRLEGDLPVSFRSRLHCGASL